MRCVPITKTNILFLSVVKTITLPEKMAKITNIRITEIQFLALQYHKMVQKAPTKFFASQKKQF